MMRVIFLFLLGIVFSCNSSDETSVIERIELEPSTIKLDLAKSETTSLAVYSYDQNNNPAIYRREVEWYVDGNAISVDNNGAVSTKSVGNAVVMAQVGNLTARCNVEVWDSENPLSIPFVQKPKELNIDLTK
ncbi:MAG: hypothetical protein Tsb0034_00950 [Ekhidna sp.]